MGRKSGINAASGSSIELDFYYKGVRCRPRIKKAPTPRNLAWAEKYKARIEFEIAEGKFNFLDHFPDYPKAKQLASQPGDAIYIKDYLPAWLESAGPYLKSSTYAGYKKIIDGRLLPAFGAVRLSRLTRATVKEWARQENITSKTLGNIISPLRVALDEAVEDSLIQGNPLAGWKIKRRKKGVRKADPIDPFSQNEQAKILGALTGANKNMVQFWLWTGLRVSELIALRWADIDFLNSRAHVSKALTQAASEAEEPKTDAGQRFVKLLPPALEALQQQKARTFLQDAEIFINDRTGKPWAGDQAIRKTMWLPALKRAGVRYRYPYQCRHTYASTLLQAGESPMWVASQMGHTDWAFTVRTYSRFIPDNAPEAGNKAAELWPVIGQQGAVND